MSAHAVIILVNQLEPHKSYKRGNWLVIMAIVSVLLEIVHWFTQRENDWGFANFKLWKVRGV